MPAPNARIAGRIRTLQNWIGGNDHNPCGADFVPPPPEHVEPLLADLCEVMTDEALPPLVQAALVHAQFETIHPFDDGNGRTGRTLIHVVLRRRGLAEVFVPPISVVFARGRDRSIDGLTAYREGEVDRWIETFATAAIQATDLAASYLDEVAQRTERWRDMLRVASDPRADAAAWAIIDLLPAHPSSPPRSPERSLDVPRPRSTTHSSSSPLPVCSSPSPAADATAPGKPPDS
jgi:Fic family protein